MSKKSKSGFTAAEEKRIKDIYAKYEEEENRVKALLASLDIEKDNHDHQFLKINIY